MFVHESCPYEEIVLNSQYQIVAVRIYIGRQNAVTFANIYIPGSVPLDLDELNRITNDLPKPATILRDFNMHGTKMGNSLTDFRGRVIEHFIDRQQLNMLNNGASTHISGTAIDLTVTSPKVIPNCDWQVYESVLNRDYFPIILTIAKLQTKENQVAISTTKRQTGKSTPKIKSGMNSQERSRK